jgi:predicted AAA+ superfamily ATPase
MAAPPPFVNRVRELRALERFWSAPAAQCIPVLGRRRVGKTFLLEQFACLLSLPATRIRGTAAAAWRGTSETRR